MKYIDGCTPIKVKKESNAILRNRVQQMSSTTEVEAYDRLEKAFTFGRGRRNYARNTKGHIGYF